MRRKTKHTAPQYELPFENSPFNLAGQACAPAAAPAIVVAHNHPSGESSPSEADIKVTRDLIRAGQLLKIQVLDSLIIGKPTAEKPGGYSSLTRAGILRNVNPKQSTDTLMDTKELCAWLETLSPGSSVVIDDDCLGLREVLASGQAGSAYLELGGLPQNNSKTPCEDCGLIGFHKMTCSYYDPT